MAFCLGKVAQSGRAQEYNPGVGGSIPSLPI